MQSNGVLYLTVLVPHDNFGNQQVENWYGESKGLSLF
jgi:hypothetical protein